MNITIETQCMADPNFRGIPFFTWCIVNELVKRQNYNYAISFFDYKRERNNYDKITSKFSDDIISKLSIKECNSYSYKDIMNRAEKGLENIEYLDYSMLYGATDGIWHLPHSIRIGAELPEKSIVTVHDVIPILNKGNRFVPKELINAFYNSHKYLEKRKDIQIITSSNSTKNDLCNCFDINNERVHVVYLAYDILNCYQERNDDILKKYGIDSNYLYYVGALDPRKGIMDIVDAFGEIYEQYDVKLVLSGPVDRMFKNNIEIIKSKPYADKIIFTGYVTDEEKRYLLSSAEIFLFPSEYEGFGIPILEAMACGCPVITTNVSSIPEVCGDAAIMIDPGNVEQLMESIKTLLNHEDKREKYSKLGLERCKMFSWENTAKGIENVYDLFN